MNTSRQLGPHASQELVLLLPDGGNAALHHNYRWFEWVCVNRVFTIYYYSLSHYGERYVYRGRQMPRAKDWTLRRYAIPLAREIRTVLMATRGHTANQIASWLHRPLPEICAIMSFHGYCSWNPLDKPHRVYAHIPLWEQEKDRRPAHFIAAASAVDTVTQVFRREFPKATPVNETEFRAEWEQRARVGRGFISPGFVTERHEAENLRIAALKESMLAKVLSAGGKLPKEWERMRPRRR